MAEKKIKIVPGSGKDLNISDVKDHIKLDKKKEEVNKDKIIIPAEKNKWFLKSLIFLILLHFLLT